MKLNGTHQLLVYADDVNILEGSVHNINEYAEAMVVAGKETGREVNAESKSRDQNSGRSHNIKTDNSSFEGVEELRYLGTNLTNQNSIQKEIKSRMNSWNACYHSAQNLLSSSLLSKNLEIKIY